MILVVMGPAGAGKSTIGRALADTLGADFIEGDHLHPAANVLKMSRGEPLDDTDREPWLAALATAIGARLDSGRAAVVACSALKAAYRRRLVVDERVRMVNLIVPPEVLQARLEARSNHFMPASLLGSQLLTYEAPAHAIAVDATRSIADVVAAIVQQLPT